VDRPTARKLRGKSCDPVESSATSQRSAFGSVAVLGLVGAPVLDAKKARRHGHAWERFIAATSDIPFLAVAQGRQRLAWREIGYRRVGLGMAVFLVALAFHRTFWAPAYDPGEQFRLHPEGWCLKTQER